VIAKNAAKLRTFLQLLMRATAHTSNRDSVTLLGCWMLR
jgi:hypothetical protein